MVTSDALVTRQDQSLSVIAVSQVEVEVALTSIFHPKTAQTLRNQTRIARRRAEEERGTRPSSPRDDEEGDHPARSGARDVRDAALQDEPTKRLKNSAGSLTQSFRRIRRRRRLPSEHRSERSEPSDTANAVSGAIKYEQRDCAGSRRRSRTSACV